MSDRDLRSRAFTVSFSDGPSMSVGSSLYRPNNSNPASPLPQARRAYILSSSVPKVTNHSSSSSRPSLHPSASLWLGLDCDENVSMFFCEFDELFIKPISIKFNKVFFKIKSHFKFLFQKALDFCLFCRDF